jgi:hypothetical protein
MVYWQEKVVIEFSWAKIGLTFSPLFLLLSTFGLVWIGLG